jgi:hypothetical protein
MPSIARTLLTAVGAMAAGAGATLYFQSQPPMPVRVGTEPTDATVPPLYQASIFPAFGAFATALAYDVARGHAPASWLGRSLLLGATTTIALRRLAGRTALSGHAVFASAVIAHELGRRPWARAPFSVRLAAGSLGITAHYKNQWGDMDGFWHSAAVGALIGLVCRRLEWRR